MHLEINNELSLSIEHNGNASGEFVIEKASLTKGTILDLLNYGLTLDAIYELSEQQYRKDGEEYALEQIINN